MRTERSNRIMWAIIIAFWVMPVAAGIAYGIQYGYYAAILVRLGL